MKKPIALLLALFMLFAVAACTNTDDPAPKDDGEGEGDGQQQTELSSVDKIKQNGKLKLGTSADYPPFEYHMMVDGQDTIVGFDIELAQLIADELGVELDITDMGFDALLISLQQRASPTSPSVTASSPIPTMWKARPCSCARRISKLTQRLIVFPGAPWARRKELYRLNWLQTWRKTSTVWSWSNSPIS